MAGRVATQVVDVKRRGSTPSSAEALPTNGRVHVCVQLELDAATALADTAMHRNVALQCRWRTLRRLLRMKDEMMPLRPSAERNQANMFVHAQPDCLSIRSKQFPSS